MLFEQALYSLPEILLGNDYSKTNYELGLVSAFSQVVLQELNGRNVLNPISCLTSEVPYQRSGYGSNRRVLRADLHLSQHTLRLGNELLSGYGWRHSNWLEAKFYRPSKSNGNTTGTALLLADLIRVTALTPIRHLDKYEQDDSSDVCIIDSSNKPKKGKIYLNPLKSRQFDEKQKERSDTGRYLLHVYMGAPEQYIIRRRNKTKTSSAGIRTWTDMLLSEGSGQITTIDLINEGDTFMEVVGRKLKHLDFSCSIHNTIVSHHNKSNKNTYTCILTRVDTFNIEMTIKKKFHRCGLDNERNVIEELKHASYRAIQNHIGENIGLKS